MFPGCCCSFAVGRSVKYSTGRADADNCRWRPDTTDNTPHILNSPPIGNSGFSLFLALLAAIAYTHRSAGETLQAGFDFLKNRFSAQTYGDNTKVINLANDSTKPVV
jgi:hypothetical protein